MSAAPSKPFCAVYAGRESVTGVSEGLNVLFADLVGHLVKLGLPVRIYTTGRHVEGLVKVLEANGVDAGAVDMRQPVRGGFFLRLLRAGSQKKKKKGPGLRQRLVAAVASLGRSDKIAQGAAWFLDWSWWNFPLKLLALVATVVLVPVLAVFGLVLGVFLSILAVGARFAFRLLRRVTAIVRARGILLPSPRGLLRSVLQDVYEELYKLECRNLATRLRREADADTFFFHTAFEGGLVEALRGYKKTVVVFPDAVAAVFATRYPANWYARNILRDQARSVRSADGLVCYSAYVRDLQLKRFLGSSVAEKRIEVIPQGFYLEKTGTGTRTVQELNRCVKTVLKDSASLGQVQFGSFEYVFYPSVDRPHKNTLLAVRAVEHLIREHQVNIKLVTSSHSASDDLARYIKERQLHREVIFMPALPVGVLNDVIAGALAVVHPSLAEGGDIFNFSRAASHDCPALLSDIPVAREMFQRYGLGLEEIAPWLFNPFDHRELAARIMDVRRRREEFVAAQRSALTLLSGYGFEDMARRYYDLVTSI